MTISHLPGPIYNGENVIAVDRTDPEGRVRLYLYAGDKLIGVTAWHPTMKGAQNAGMKLLAALKTYTFLQSQKP